MNLDKHIIVPEIDKDKKFVEDYIYNLSKSSLDKSRPLWDLHILQVKTLESEEAEGITIFCMHHSLGDGTSLRSLLMAITRKTSDPEALPTLSAPKRCIFGELRLHQQHKRNQLIGRSWELLLWLWWVLVLSWNTLVDVARFAATIVFLKDTNTPLKGVPGAEFTRRRVIYKS